MTISQIDYVFQILDEWLVNVYLYMKSLFNIIIYNLK